MNLENKLSLTQWIEEAEKSHKSFGEFCLAWQAADMGITENDLIDRMEDRLDVMEAAISFGLKSARSKSGLTGGDGFRMKVVLEEHPEGQIVGSTMAGALAMALATGECNACMGRIVAAPTAGSSGVLPAVLFAVGDSLAAGRRCIAVSLVAAGAIGMVIASRATLAGAEGGCQAECGAAAAMAAGAAVDMCGGTPKQVGHAVAMALKSMLGLVCDPVAGLVEVPCIKRNAGATAMAMAAAEMALAGIESVIPADEVIDAMASIGHRMPSSLRETAQGGLAVTPAGKAIADRLARTAEKFI